MLRQSLPQPPSPHQLFHIWFGLQFGRHLRIAVALALVLAIGCNGNFGQNQHVKQTPSADQQRLEPPRPNGERLVEYVRTQLSWGPRVPGTPAHDSCRRWLIAQLRASADTVFEQRFEVTVYGKRYACTNILARLFPSRMNRVLLCAHWDSRPTADEDPIRSNRSKPIPGANDGASGVAVVLELVRLLRQQPPGDVGIDVALFDAEDMGAPSDETMFCLGSKQLVRDFPFPNRPRYGILFDLVGDQEAKFPIEYNSQTAAEPLVARLWNLGALYGGGHFVQQVGGSVVDDHLSLIEFGIPTANIIDIELVGNRAANQRRRYWHTLADDLRNISGATMSSVVRVVLALLYSETPFPL